jgi:hypothetical protein
VLEAIYRDWRLLVNFFQPVRKLLSKERVGSKVRKKYDLAQTPYQRVLASPLVSKEDEAKLRELYRTLNPVKLQRRVRRNLEQLRGSMGNRNYEAKANSSVTVNSEASRLLGGGSYPNRRMMSRHVMRSISPRSTMNPRV